MDKPKIDVPPPARHQPENSVVGPEGGELRAIANAKLANAARQHLDRHVKCRRYWGMAIIDLTAEASEQYDALAKPIKRRVERLVARLQRWPIVSGVKALSGNLAGHYRLRTGDYRVQFRAERLPDEGDWLLIVEKIGHRDGFYDE